MKFEREKKARESRKKATTIDVKEVKYRPTIDTNDFDIKTNKAATSVQGQEGEDHGLLPLPPVAPARAGTKILDQVTERPAEVGTGREPSRLEGRQMTMIMSPPPRK
jgi:translation initiation factor IF-3